MEYRNTKFKVGQFVRTKTLKYVMTNTEMYEAYKKGLPIQITDIYTNHSGDLRYACTHPSFLRDWSYDERDLELFVSSSDEAKELLLQGKLSDEDYLQSLLHIEKEA